MTSASTTIPHFEKIAKSQQLHVDGKPFLMLGAELQNSSMSSAEYMKPIWQKLVDMNINTVLGNVTWEAIEPEEGKFDFSELDLVVEDARAHGLRLVLLWFGSFKNGLSTYTPAWVKKNAKRFPRVQLRKAGGVLKTADIVSVFHDETRDADAKAFSMLMRHIKEIDEGHFTVIMVQVENEVGVIGDSRDAGSAANKKFSEPVPKQLIDHFSTSWNSLHPDLTANLKEFKARGRTSGSWEEVFGRSQQTDEIFMAYHYALFLEYVAAAGRKEYPLPLFTNVWLNNEGDDRDSSFPVMASGGGEPGHYPSGGPLSNVLDIWMAFAPTLDFIGPDIYLADYERICSKYRHLGQPLLIPEQRKDEYGARRIWRAFGSYQAIGTCPFGIDTVEPEVCAFTKHYRLLSQVKDFVLEAQRKPGSSFGFFFDELAEDGRDPTPPTVATFGEWEATISRSFVFGKPGPGAGMIIQLEESKFLLVGWGFQVKWRNLSPKSIFTGILSYTEKMGDGKTGKLTTGRKLNGDESESGKLCIMPNEEPDNGGFPIPLCIPARTMIAECEVYSLEEDSSDSRVRG